MKGSAQRMQYLIEISSLRYNGDERNSAKIGKGLAYDLTELIPLSVVDLCKEGKKNQEFDWGYFVRSVGPDKYFRVEGNGDYILITDMVNSGRRRLAEAINLNEKKLKKYDGNVRGLEL